jgi:hypothetical protein
MPFKYCNNIVAVEVKELVPAFWNEKNLYQKLWLQKEKPFGIKRLEGCFKDGVGLIDFDTLPREIQEALGDPRKTNHPLESYFEFDANAVRYYNRFKRDNGSHLTAEEQEKYIINASVMTAVVKLKNARIQERIKMRGSLKGITESLRTDVISFQNSLKVLHQKEHTIPPSMRFKEYLKSFEDNSYYSIIKDPTGSRKDNARKVFDHTENLLNSLFAKQLHKPTPTEVARQYDSFLTGYVEVFNQDTGEVYNPKDFKQLSTATITNYISKWENALSTFKARSGDRQVYMGKFKPHHQMELPKLAGSIISIDDRQPPFVYNTKNDRVWFYLGVDIASQAITTFVFGKTKEGIILDFYRQMVRNYTEWGFCLPYELECESSLNSSFKDSLLRPGAMFQEVKIEANNARGKYIERINGMLRYGDEKTAAGWLARPTAKSEANQLSAVKKHWL